MNKVAFFTAIFLIFVSFASNSSERNIELNLSLAESKDQINIEFNLLNKRNKVACIERGSLPWGTVYSMSIVAIVPGAMQKQLQRSWVIDDAPLGKICIEPNGSAKGVLNASEIFPDLADQLTRSDVILFWFYENKEQNFEDGGYISVKRKS